MSYDSITIPASGYVSLKKNGLSLSNIRMASIITYSRIDPPKPFCVYGNSTVAYVYGEPGTVITELKVRFWYWLNSNSLKDYVKIGTYKDLTIKTTGTSISFIVKWENTLHELIYNTNDVLMFRISSDNGQTWTTKKQIW